MKKIFELAQNLQNLNRIKRAGGNLAIGLPTSMNLSIAEHSYSVTYLAMLFADVLGDKEVSVEKVLRYALTHDWREMIVGDIPAGSPSYASFWGINIREEVGKAGDKAMEEILESIKEEVDIDLYKSNLNDKEKQIIKTADWVAYLLEMQEWKYLGYNHEGWEMIWFNTLNIVEKIELPFIPNLISEIKESYKRGTKRPSPWLAKASKQVNPEHKLN
ncbi:HD domain-containing protein [Candidatus Shapirobacteria bacterium]|nr:HD domain-containing protein [Candidatus Shapirobacteria bacterium]